MAPASKSVDSTAAPSISSPSSDNTESVSNQSRNTTSPTVVVSVLVVLGVLFIIVVTVLFVILKKKKQLNAQMAQDKQQTHPDASRYSSDNDYHANEQVGFTYNAVVSPCYTDN
ncbi:hypothetical protein PHMEG_00029067 [Phytophthora megakarya]|uniref:Uncharacterized protein n=1 Tax=Phytophthora megakarya TaxID=4795 RepID=A0A225V4K3_9STRA|nr:hypothetical protein PHMEG_00029067 [Phytophthora megakarya]